MSRPIRKFIAFWSPLLLGITLVQKSGKESAICDSLSRVDHQGRTHREMAPCSKGRSHSYFMTQTWDAERHPDSRLAPTASSTRRWYQKTSAHNTDGYAQSSVSRKPSLPWPTDLSDSSIECSSTVSTTSTKVSRITTKEIANNKSSTSKKGTVEIHAPSRVLTSAQHRSHWQIGHKTTRLA
jgi:hypothetical protein